MVKLPKKDSERWCGGEGGGGKELYLYMAILLRKKKKDEANIADTIHLIVEIDTYWLEYFQYFSICLKYFIIKVHFLKWKQS